MTTPDYGPTRVQIARMRAKISEGIVARERRARVRRRVTFAVSGLTAASLITGGVVLATVPDTIADVFICYTADDLSSTTHGISYPMDVTPPTRVSEQVRWALDLCVLARDLVGQPQPVDPVVCRLPDLRLGVFPDDEGRGQDAVCAGLGLLEPLDPIPGYETPQP